MDGRPSGEYAGERDGGKTFNKPTFYAGLDQWIAKSNDTYVDIAKNLASQGPRSSEKRMAMRTELENSALADGARLSSELEKIYRTLRRRFSFC